MDDKRTSNVFSNQISVCFGVEFVIGTPTAYYAFVCAETLRDYRHISIYGEAVMLATHLSDLLDACGEPKYSLGVRHYREYFAQLRSVLWLIESHNSRPFSYEPYSHERGRDIDLRIRIDGRVFEYETGGAVRYVFNKLLDSEDIDLEFKAIILDEMKGMKREGEMEL